MTPAVRSGRGSEARRKGGYRGLDCSEDRIHRDQFHRSPAELLRVNDRTAGCKRLPPSGIGWAKQTDQGHPQRAEEMTDAAVIGDGCAQSLTNSDGQFQASDTERWINRLGLGKL